ncbi:hypothetical protein BO94DRAFT_581693 [Aspergillus sclerotioniger CBS 115572]|uniref:Uncharacterized protein n=1 Tax=Aspergillus sclerotioniger CBS 115572 TaxID=1450535 RepID=A0A317XEI3_9EURO|nr:hypothetical protein BO94DRAFT_581693 [Aspergillus sclerotioniger CBS 115572]PWY95358.1 hypothetical protein BO94DRAFT_581693 [Aspergillus sclerotioniger CBS 115572]
MKFTSILLTLSASVTLVSAGDYYCPFAQDNSGMIQQPYCCDGFTDSEGGSVAKEGQNCQSMTTWVDECPKGGSVKCCYTIGPVYICTAEAEQSDD